MPDHEKNFFSGLGHLPGLVILCLSMISLYYGALLVNTKQDLQYYFDSYETKLTDFEVKYQDFKENLIQPDNGKGQAAKKILFSNLTHAVERLNTRPLERNLKTEVTATSFYLVLFRINEGIIRLNDLQTKINSAKEKQNLEMRGRLQENLAEMDEDVRLLRLAFFDMFTKAIFSSETSKIENLLYWSIIAMGLCGFVLMVLNGHKLMQLRQINLEKRITLADLESKIAALEMAYEGVWIADNSGYIVFMNAAMLNFLGIEQNQKSEILNRLWQDIILNQNGRINKDDIFSHMADKNVWRGEYAISRQSGGQIFTDMTITRLPNGGVIGTIEDLTEKKKAFLEKKELEEQFFQAQKMEAIGRLAGGIAHDFNNILAAMNGYAEFLVEDLNDREEQQQFARNILSAGMQARDLVDQMLAFSRRNTSEKGAVNLLDIIKEARAMLSASLPKTIEMKEDIRISRALLEANATQISQLIMNLCVNAQDAMENERGTLELTVEELEHTGIHVPNPSDTLRSKLPEEKATPYLRIESLSARKTRLILGHIAAYRNYIRLQVKDTGSGMSREIMERVFEPFFTTKSVDKGTGLGLSTVHGVVISHKAMMIITSEIGAGTSFEIFFPAMFEKKSQIEAASPANDVKMKSESLPKTVLVVEDQDKVREMIMTTLERQGFDAFDCSNGHDAIQIIDENPDAFDVILSDQNMPEMTGIEMIQILHKKYPNIPFIILSGYSEKKIQALIDNHPAIKAVLRKPVAGDVLAKNINAVTSKLRQSI